MIKKVLLGEHKLLRIATDWRVTIVGYWHNTVKGINKVGVVVFSELILEQPRTDPNSGRVGGEFESGTS